MSKRTLLMVVALIAAVAIAATGTLAYLTDTDSDVNVMTLGNVDIEQHELERGNNVADDATMIDGSLTTFVQGQPLFPAYAADDTAYEPQQDELVWGEYVTADEDATSNLWDDDKLTGALDKFVFVENTGASDAYVRTVFAFEAPDADVEALLHFNRNDDLTWTDHDVYITVEGVRYKLVSAVYPEALAAGKTSVPSLLQVALDHTATNEDVEKLGETYEILVLSQAVQVENLDKLGAKGALDAAFGDVTEENATLWFSEMAGLPVTTASTAEELTAALANGGTVVLTNDIELTDEPIMIAKGTDATIVIPEGVTIEGASTNKSASNQLVVESGATLTLSGSGELSFTAGSPDTDWGDNGPKPYPGYASNTIKNSGKLIIDGVTVKNNTGKGGASYAIDNYPGADLIVNSGSIQQTGGDVAIRMFANSKTVPTNVTINGGTIEGKRAVWVQIPGSNPADALIANLTINGGTLSSTDDPTGTYLAIYSYSYGNSFANTNINITGGTFNGHVAFGGGYQGDTENVTITGGTFNADLGRYLANDGWEDIAKP